MGDTTDTPTYELRPTEARWTHIALRVADVDASIAWYQEFTPLELLDKRQDYMGFGAWLGQPDSPDKPFILVLAQFLPETDPFRDYPREVLAPFAHFGVELPERADIDAIAARARPPGAWPCPRSRCRTRSATCACCAIPTGTWSSSPSTRACTPRRRRCGAAGERRARGG